MPNGFVIIEHVTDSAEEPTESDKAMVLQMLKRYLVPEFEAEQI